MKRNICLVLVLSLFLLCGCTSQNDVNDRTVFYYVRSEYTYAAEDSVIAAEERDITGHSEDIRYLLSLYLVGPLDESLDSPFPSGTQLISVENTGENLILELTDSGDMLSEAQFSLACACLTMTCLDLLETEQVTITSGDRSITLDQNSLLLYDHIIPLETNPTEDSQ